MLMKLTKYELKGTGRLLLPLYGALLVLGLLVRLYMFSSETVAAIQTPEWLDLIGGLTIFAYGGVMTAVFVVTFIILVQRFYKNLLGDEGYLMMTLPVPTWQHIISKMLAAMVWCLVSAFVALLSGLLIVVNWEFFAGFDGLFREIIPMLGKIELWEVVWVCFSGVVLLLVMGAAEIMNLYAAMAVGHMANRHKLLCSFGVYIIMNMVCGAAMDLLDNVLNLFGGNGFGDWIMAWGDRLNALQAVSLSMWLLIALSFLVGAVFFAITNWVLNHKLNLE